MKRFFVCFFLRHTQFCLDFTFLFIVSPKTSAKVSETFWIYKKRMHGLLDDFE